MQELEASWPRAVAVWWLVVWRTLVGGLVLGLGSGFLIGLVGTLAGVDHQYLTFGSAIVGWALGLAWGLVVIRMALKKHYADFRLALVPGTSA